MIDFEKRVLGNGLTVVVHTDTSTPLCATNILYKVGSKNENSNKTGFAHLFEHLMFGGSQNVPNFDEPIQLAGGENNAFTNSDITNFYNHLPAQNLETALWVESDRMANLIISEEALVREKKVVVEEFKEVCLNQPYGDVWHLLSDLSYKNHPYRWPTIGLMPQHIEESTIDDVLTFFKEYYGPQNAILVIAGNVQTEEGFALAEKWFGDIPGRRLPTHSIPEEGEQREKRTMAVNRNVPMDAIYRTYHMGGRQSTEYYACDLLTDVLGNGRSSRFYQNLYKDTGLFSKIDCYITGTNDPGLLIVDAKLSNGSSEKEAWRAIDAEIDSIKTELISTEELEKVKNKVVSSLVFSEVSVLNRAISLAYFENLGDIHLINQQVEKYESITAEDLRTIAGRIFMAENCSELSYHAVA